MKINNDKHPYLPYDTVNVIGIGQKEDNKVLTTTL